MVVKYYCIGQYLRALRAGIHAGYHCQCFTHTQKPPHPPRTLQHLAKISPLSAEARARPKKGMLLTADASIRHAMRSAPIRQPALIFGYAARRRGGFQPLVFTCASRATG